LSTNVVARKLDNAVCLVQWCLRFHLCVLFISLCVSVLLNVSVGVWDLSCSVSMEQICGYIVVCKQPKIYVKAGFTSPVAKTPSHFTYWL